jgi:lipopolysaccharide biosynthesis protein
MNVKQFSKATTPQLGGGQETDDLLIYTNPHNEAFIETVLCAEADRQVTLSREKIGSWESFMLSSSKVDFLEQMKANIGPSPDHKSDSAELSALPHPPVRLIAFYLPQYHPIPENDAAWGKGFTEWTNVSKGLPRFEGHYQPRLPGELGFYDLRLEEVIRQQADLARKYGISGFCFHHYWFGGKRLLEGPLNKLIANPDINIPFCINWANENWTRNWDGGSSQIIQAQRHSPEDDLAFIRSVELLMRDKRYIRVNGRPLVLIYRPKLLPDAASTVSLWRRELIGAGMGNPYVVMCHSFEHDAPNTYGMDAAAGFPPHRVGFGLPDIRTREPIAELDSSFSGNIRSYREMAEQACNLPKENFVFFHGVCPSWDNEARRPARGDCFAGSSPRSYGTWLEQACRRTLDERVGDERIVFVNAWNEWGEGAYLEPDRHYGYAYLAETARVLNALHTDCPPSDFEIQSNSIRSVVDVLEVMN